MPNDQNQHYFVSSHRHQSGNPCNPRIPLQCANFLAANGTEIWPKAVSRLEFSDQFSPSQSDKTMQTTLRNLAVLVTCLWVTSVVSAEPPDFSTVVGNVDKFEKETLTISTGDRAKKTLELKVTGLLISIHRHDRNSPAAPIRHQKLQVPVSGRIF